MNEDYSPPVETENNKSLTPLVERLDSSIGELSTAMGGMMTELLRRTLRGSVRQIDDELQGQVAQKVDATIAHRLPAIEQSAVEVAEKAAREAATEVAVEEMHALEQRTKEGERELASRIETTARTAQQQTVETASALTGKIELVEQKAELAITNKAHELNSRIEEAERRANEAAQAEVTRQVEEALLRSRKATAGMKDPLQDLETRAGILKKQLLSEADDRKTGHTTLRADVDRRLNAVLHELRLLEEGQTRLQRELTDAQKRNEALAARVTELEKPRGLRALWAWLFGRRKTAPAAMESSGEEEENEANPDHLVNS